MAYRRGFKTEAEILALEVRGELGLGALDPLAPLRLAEHLDIPVIGLGELRGRNPWAIDHLRTIEPSAFSAVTVFRGYERTIVHNDAHAAVRQVSNLAHELAHGLMQHRPTAALDDRGCRLWDQAVEDEAQFLAGALLIPRDSCIAAVFRGKAEAGLADSYGVSREMARYRLGVSGATTIAKRARERRRSTG